MAEVPEYIERLIVRRLDGEITEEEQLDLDRELLRRPEARELLASYERIDVLAADAIAEIAEGADRCTPVLVLRQAPQPLPVSRRRWMLPVSAMAACLALVILWQTPSIDKPTPTPGGATIAQNQQGIQQPNSSRVFDAAIPVVGAPMDGGVWSTRNAPAQRVDRNTERNVILVPDGKGNFYLINVDRVQEIQQPKNGIGIPTYRDPI